MKIPNREINIFNLSMLDIICGALGAFLIVTILLIPSYQNQAKIKTADVKEKKKQNERMKEKIELKKKALAKDNERLEKMRDANRELERQLVRGREELERMRRHRQPGEIGPSPPTYIYVYWWWESNAEGEGKENPLINVKVGVVDQSSGVLPIGVTENPRAEFDPAPPGTNRKGHGGKFIVVKNPSFKEVDLQYAVSPHAPARMFIGGYVQSGEQLLALGEVLLDGPKTKGEWKHFHGTLKRVAAEGGKQRELAFELSEDGRKFDNLALAWHRDQRQWKESESERLREMIRERQRRIDELIRKRRAGSTRSKSSVPSEESGEE